MANGFCFICLAKVERSEVNLFGNTKRSTSAIRILLKYILDTNGGSGGDNEVVLEDVLKLIGIGSGGAGGEEDDDRKCGWMLCRECEGVAGKVLGLQLELERVQMRIEEQVKLARAWILAISGWLGGGSGGKGGDDAFGNFAKQFCDGQTSPKERKVFEVLKGFQNAVREKGQQEKKPPQFPLVYSEGDAVIPIHKSKGKNHNLRQRHLRTELKNDNAPDIKIEVEDDVVVKEEQEELDSLPGADSYSEFCTDSPKPPPPPPPCRSQSIQNITVYEIRPRQGTNSSTLASTSQWSQPQPQTKKELKPILTTGKRKPRARRLYKCESCDFTVLTRVHVFEQHLRGHETEEKLFHCKFCKLGFSTQQHHLFHESRHRGKHELRCDVCRRWLSAYELESHLKTHVEKVFACGNCSHCSSSFIKYMEHVLSNHGGSDLKCCICGESCSSRKKLEDHIYEKHGEAEKLECDFEGCDKTFLNARALGEHKVCHTKRFTCKECGKTFRNNDTLMKHEQIHSSEDNFRCDQCPAAFGTKGAFQTHLTREHGAPKKKCKICGKEYNSAAGLRAHINKDHEEKFKCPICGKPFPSRHAVQTHVESHSSENNYICAECGKSFKSAVNFRCHRKTHGERNLKCPHCPKAFAKRINLNLHLRVHTGQKPFPCPVCGKRFSQAGARMVHRKRCELKAKASTTETNERRSTLPYNHQQ